MDSWFITVQSLLFVLNVQAGLTSLDMGTNVKAISSILRILFFLQNHEFFCFLCRKFLFFYHKITHTQCIHQRNHLWCGGYDLRLKRVRSCVRIPYTNSFFNPKIFYHLIKISRVHTVARPF